MADYNLLKRISQSLEKELPATEGAAARELAPASQAASDLPAVITKDGEVIGQGTSKASLPPSPQDADVLSQGGKTGPDPVAITDQSTNPDYTNWLNRKNALIGLGIAGAGAGTAYLMANKDGSPQASASIPPTDNTQTIPASAFKGTTVTGKGPVESSDDSTPSAPSAPSSNAPAKPSDAEDNDSFKPKYIQPNMESLNELKAIQQRQRDAQMVSGVAQAGADMAYGMGGVNRSNDEFFKLQNQRIAGMTDKYKEQVAFQKYDPNSAVSQTYRQLADYLKIPVHPGSSAADNEKVLPQIAEIKSAEEANETREKMNENTVSERKFRDQQMALYKNQIFQQQDDKRSDNDLIKLGTAINFNRQARGNAPQIANIVNYGQRIKTILDPLPKLPNGQPDLSKMPVGDKPLLMDAMNNLVAGKATISGGKELTDANKSMMGDASRVMQYLSGKPMQGNEGGILQNIYSVLNQEVQFATEKEKDLIHEAATPFQRLQDKKPGEWNNIMGSHQMDAVDWKLRDLGYQGYDINRLTQQGYSKPDILKFALDGKSPSSVKPPTAQGSNSPGSQQSPGSYPVQQAPASANRQVIKKGYNPKTNQTQLVYSDGTKEVVSGQQ